MAGAQGVVVLQAFPFLQTRCPSQPGHGHTAPKERQDYANQHNRYYVPKGTSASVKAVNHALCIKMEEQGFRI